MVGYLVMTQRATFEPHLGVVRNDIDDIVYSLLSLGVSGAASTDPRFKADIRKIMRKYYETALADMPPTETIDEMLSLAANYQVRLQPI